MDNKEIKLIEMPEKYELDDESNYYKIRAVEINGKSEALMGLLLFEKKDKKDLKKLINTLKAQLKSKEIIHNKEKVQQSKKKGQENIIEIKANKGKSRLFGYISEDDELIICTNTYWKSDNIKLQAKAFDKSESIYKQFLNK